MTKADKQATVFQVDGQVVTVFQVDGQVAWKGPVDDVMLLRTSATQITIVPMNKRVLIVPPGFTGFIVTGDGQQ